MKKTDELTKNLDSVLLVFYILKRLGCGNVNTFEERLKNQKVHYFAQLFGITKRYQYNFYIRGPYSPNLAHDLYKVKEYKIKMDSDTFVPDELEMRFKDLKKFIGRKNNRQLELISTLHWFVKVLEYPVKIAKVKLIEIKKASKQEIEYALSALKKYEKIKKNYS